MAFCPIAFLRKVNISCVIALICTGKALCYSKKTYNWQVVFATLYKTKFCCLYINILNCLVKHHFDNYPVLNFPFVEIIFFL